MKTMLCLFIFIFSLLFSASVNSATWKDDFNDGKDDGWQVFTGTWKVENSSYRMPKEAFGPPYPITYAMDGKKVGDSPSKLKSEMTRIIPRIINRMRDLPLVEMTKAMDGHFTSDTIRVN